MSSGKGGERGAAAKHPGAVGKTGWIRRRLRDITTKIGSGATPLGGEAAYKKSGVSLIRSLNVHDTGFRTKDLAFIDADQARQLDNVVVEAGDVLLNITGASIARCCLVPTEILPARVNQHVSILRPMKEHVLSELLRYMLISRDYKDRLLHAGESGGATRQALTKAQLQGLWIEYPESLPEERRIVGILDEAFAGIATATGNAEKNLENARELFESHLQAVFTKRGDGWVERRLDELATFRNGINFTRSSRGESVKIVGVRDFQNNYWAPLDKLEIATTDGPLPDSDLLKENDLLFVRSNGNIDLIGRCVLVGAVTERVTHSGFTIRARLHGGGIMPKYICNFLKSNKARREMIDSGIGTNIKSLNQATLSALVIPLPSLDAQARIVGQLELLSAETQRLAALYQRKLTALDELKKSLLHQAFTGQL